MGTDEIQLAVASRDDSVLAHQSNGEHLTQTIAGGDYHGDLKETVIHVGETTFGKKGSLSLARGHNEERKSLLQLDSTSGSDGDISSQDSNTESFCHRLAHLCQCCMVENFKEPMDEDSCGERCRYAMLCPPHGKIAKFFCILVLAFLAWGVPWSITPEEALPGGNIFGIIILLLSCMAAGYLISHIPLPGIPPLPPLLGMLIMGFLLRNVPYIDVAKDIDQHWSSSLRLIALTVILTRAGIGLDGQALIKLKWILLGFACSTSIVECAVVAAFSTLMINFPWDWGFVIGFVLCAVSPAVVVPSLLYLQDKGFGVEGGIPTFLIAGAALNDVIGITGFNVILGMIFSEGDIVEKIVHGPLELIFGVGAGVILGVFLWYFPAANMKGRTGYRTGMLLGLGLFCGFASKFIHFAGSGALATLVMAFVAALRWGPEKKPVAKAFANLWVIFQPLLFGLIGASVTIDSLEPETVGLGAGLILIGLTFRSAMAFLAVYFSSSFDMREKIFMTIAWVPKATVQAAIGAVALDMAIEHGASEEVIERGTKVLTIAVLSILITAPTGAAAIGLCGPKLLKQSQVDDDETKTKP